MLYALVGASSCFRDVVMLGTMGRYIYHGYDDFEFV